jgi:hypothetical protein
VDSRIGRGPSNPYGHIWILTLKGIYAEGLQQIIPRLSQCGKKFTHCNRINSAGACRGTSPLMLLPISVMLTSIRNLQFLKMVPTIDLCYPQFLNLFSPKFR